MRGREGRKGTVHVLESAHEAPLRSCAYSLQPGSRREFCSEPCLRYYCDDLGPFRPIVKRRERKNLSRSPLSVVEEVEES